MKGRNEQSCDYLRKNILDKGHTGRQRPDRADLLGHGKGFGICSACEGGPLEMWRMMGRAGTILAALWRMGYRKEGVAAGKQEVMVVAGVMERSGGTEIEIGGRTVRTCWWMMWDTKESKESLVTPEFCGWRTSISVVSLSSVRCHEISKWR